ncbi:MAG: DUF3244 domain-containing protein [Bacteroides sp.]|nr:DUF3244 domain-containing protein [Bacteroides sp.]
MNGLYILILNLSLVTSFSSVELWGRLSNIATRSIISPVTVYQCNEALQLEFTISDLEQLDIKIENTMTSEVMYKYSLNPQQETTLYIPISEWESGSYTIYFVNPINDLYMYGEFYKE